MNPILQHSATHLARAIRTRKLTSSEVVEEHIRHVERVNPKINAVVCARFDEARREAAEADRRIARGDPDLPELLGVPCTIKEAFALTGMPNTSGLVARKGRRAESDAIAVARLRAAGAIPLGVTNVSELCMWMESANNVYGRTSNPYDLGRTAGGSSGGEGAIVGAGGVPFGLGSDIGGSIRMPAFFNGVFGHKPTGGLIDNGGQWPLPAEGAIRYVTTGPLARCAEDLAPLVRILAGPSAKLGDPASVDISDLHVVSIEHNGAFRVDAELIAAQRRAADALADRGARVRTCRLKGLERSLEIWSAMLDAAGGPSFASMLGGGTPIAAGRELGRWMLGRSPHTLPAIGLALLEGVPKRMPGRARAFVEAGAALRRELVGLVGERGVLLYPSYPEPAPRHVAPLLVPIRWTYTAILNVLEMPATQVPLGLGRRGLPLGVQVAAVHGNDHMTIAVAQELERAFGGWAPPPIALS